MNHFKALSNQRGVTLIELIFTILLMGFLSYMAIPALSGYIDSTNLDVVSRQVEIDFRYAQTLSMATGDSYGVKITSATEYEVYNVGTGNAVDSPYNRDPMQYDLSKKYNGVEFQLGAYPMDIQFDGNGVANNATTMIIPIVNAEGDSDTLQVQPETGSVERL